MPIVFPLADFKTRNVERQQVGAHVIGDCPQVFGHNFRAGGSLDDHTQKPVSLG